MLPIQTPDNLFKDGIPGGDLGTPVTAAWLNAVQTEILNVQQAAGLVPSNANNQLLRATMTCLVNGTPLPPQNIGPIWHDDYNSVMTWQSFTNNGANYVGYASVLIGSLMLDTQPTARSGYVKSGAANLSRTTDAALRAWAMHNGVMVALGVWQAGQIMCADNADGTTFRIFDVRGEFLRAWDDGRGVDSGRAFGSAQAGTNHPNVAVFANSATTGTLVSPAMAAWNATYPNHNQPDSTADSIDLVSTGNYLSVGLTTTGNTSQGKYYRTRPRNTALTAVIKR